MSATSASIETPGTIAIPTDHGLRFSHQLKEWTERLPWGWCESCTMTWDEFWAGGLRDDALLIDIRDDVKNKQVPGAIHIPMGTFLSQMAKHELIDEDEPAIIFCNTDNRSCMALFLLKAMGYAKIRKIDGGYQEYLQLTREPAKAAS